MASTSASSVQKSFKYDVFLSFRGEDTRKTFVDHLYHALVNKGIVTYKDDETIEKGERISEQLIRSIQDSRFYIIVFSKTYASSSWCLEELVKIMECQKMAEHTAYPIFFDVEPTEVRNQSGAVGEAFARHVSGSWSLVLPLDCVCSIVASCCNGSSSLLSSSTLDLENEDDVGRWRNAMKEAAGLAGMELKNTFNGHEAKFIQQIVEKVSLKLLLFNPRVDGKLVGMEARVKDIVSSLETDANDVRMIGIKGMGGGGKTTLARAVFDYISIRFEGKSFIENVREGSKGSGLKELQKKLLQNVLNVKSIEIESAYEGKSQMKKEMSSRKVLIVLDDVDNMEQLEALAGEPAWFKPGSRIIITTRDEQVLKAHQVNFIHDVNLLSRDEALLLFSRYAFAREIPNEGYEELSRMVVRYAAGLPLTIKVLGSFLYGRIEGEWRDTIKRLKTIPWNETLKKLELSYESLENDQKEIFLDIACILKGETKETAIQILESFGFHAQIGLRVLEQKSLISISKDDQGRLLLHDHIEEMGRNIVRHLHPHEPKRHSRLWTKKEIEDILVNESGTEETKCIKLGYTTLPLVIIMKGLRKLKELRFLYVNTYTRHKRIGDVTPYIPDSLQYLCWYQYPFKSLPESFQGNKLVNLKMRESKLLELWGGGEKKVLNNLKFLDLSYSMLRTFDLTVAPQLEELNLHRCSDLVELQFPIECPNLKVLNLSGSKVSNLNLGMTLHLEKLHLSECGDLVELQFPIECLKLKVLYLFGSKVSNLNLGMTPGLEKLYLDECSDLVELQLPVECPNLKFLNLSGSKVSNLNLGLTPNLEKLHLRKCCCLQKIHAPVGCLKKLVDLLLIDCSSFKRFKFKKQHESDDVKITAEYVGRCPLHGENRLPAFKFECIYDEAGSSWSGNLEKLISSASGLCACKNREYLFATISCLQHLRKLTLKFSIPGDQWQFKHLKSLNISKCDGIGQLQENISRLECLEELHLERCRSLRGISNSPMKCLKRLRLYDCGQIEKLTEELECLEELYIDNCSSLREITNIGKMKCLKRLRLSCCDQVERLSEELGRLECLVELEISTCRWLPDVLNDICKMKCLEYLSLSDCLEVEKLPEELGRLQCLKKLELAWCQSLRDIPNRICKMKCLTTLDLSFCRKLEKLPEELGSLECLKELDIRDTNISCLPQSINQLKGLRIIGSEEQLQSYGFTSVTELISGDVLYHKYYVEL